VPNIFKPTSRAELERSRSYPASGSVNEHALALVEFRDTVDQLIRGGIVQNQTDRFGRIEPGGTDTSSETGNTM
jgi:hypothetical protein